MADPRMKIPNVDHPIAIEPNPARIVVRVAGHVVADTRNALTLREANRPPVLYMPRGDIDRTVLTRTATTSFCPYKGDASYYTITVGDDVRADAAWAYETPFRAVDAIVDHIAFYPDRVDVIEAWDDAEAGHDR
ncbi:DUF427 domain-containing protein (plasmid) [Brevundimonas staleyi]|uniref:DUF427 domain-containing protein n=1 Tax=Brevundimonas staleyi TaxID=74326 RepID=A0ABW0FPL0_9CAUL